MLLLLLQPQRWWDVVIYVRVPMMLTSCPYLRRAYLTVKHDAEITVAPSGGQYDKHVHLLLVVGAATASYRQWVIIIITIIE